MRFGEHGHGFPFLGIVVQLFDELFQHGNVHLLQGLFHRERHAGVVDVLRGESEVYELLEGIKSANLVELLLDEVFHRFHIVVGHLLDVFHPLGIGHGEVLVDGAQARK